MGGLVSPKVVVVAQELAQYFQTALEFAVLDVAPAAFLQHTGLRLDYREPFVLVVLPAHSSGAGTESTFVLFKSSIAADHEDNEIAYRVPRTR